MEQLIVTIATIVSVIVGIIAAVLAWPGARVAWRQLRERRAGPEPILTERLRVLAVIPAPVLGPVGNNPPSEQLDIWKEWQNLEAAIKEPHPDGRGKPIALTRLLPPTRDQLRQALKGCDVLHFCGHGTASGLILETEHGREELVSCKDFAGLFAGSKVKLVVLSACESIPTAKALRKAGVPAVVATQAMVLDDVAKYFASSFYAELTDGAPFNDALTKGQSAVAGEYREEAAQNFMLLGRKSSRLAMPSNPAEAPLIDLGEPKGTELVPTHLGMVNRGAELVKISEELDYANTRLVSIHGIGGIGKSVLAAEAVHRNAWRFPDGVLWLRVETPKFQLSDLCRHIGYLLDFKPEELSEERLRHQAQSALGTHKCLIALDNAETILPDERKQIAQFLGGFDPRRGGKVLVTARERVAAFNQLDGATPLDTVRSLSDIDAMSLLYEEAWRRNLFRQIERRVAEFVEHGRGHPFLLSRSVAWAKDRGVESVLRDLANLKGDAEAAAKELVGKMAAGLTEAGKYVLRRVPIFEGGADEGAIHAVCGKDAAEGIRELTERSLLDFDHQTQRYTLHLLVVDYVKGYMKLEPNDERTARQKHAQHYLTVAERYDQTPMERWRDLDVDWENIRNGANFAARELAKAFGVGDDPESLQSLLAEKRTIEGYAEQVQLAADYALALKNYVLRRRTAEGLRWLLVGAVAFQTQGDKKRLGLMYNQIGLIYDAQGEYPKALEWYQQSVAINEQLGNRAVLATTLHNMGLLEMKRERLQGALDYFRRSRALYAQIGLEKDVADEDRWIAEVQRRLAGS